MTCPCSNKRFSEQTFNRMGTSELFFSVENLYIWILGLESDHAYSILDARQVNNQRLVRLRNPWGEKEWKGALHENWTKWPKALKNKLSTSSPNDGVFWMRKDSLIPWKMSCIVLFLFWIAWEQMPSFFSSVTICKVNANWHEVSNFYVNRLSNWLIFF